MELSIPIKKFFRFLGILIMGTYFLPIVFENLFFPFSTVLLYLLLWTFSVLLLHPKVLLSKRLVYIYLFIIIYFIFIVNGLFQIEYIDVWREIQAIFFAIVLLQYFLISKDYKGLKLIIKTAFIFIALTLITSIVGLYKFPMAARDLAGGLALEGQYHLIEYYESIGIAGYGFFYGLVFLLPAVIAILKSSIIDKPKNIWIYFFIIISLFGVYKSQFTTALIYAIIGTSLAFWTKGNLRPAIVRLVFLLSIVILIPQEQVLNWLDSFTDYLESGVIYDRLVALRISLEQGIGEGHTHIDYRYARIPVLINNFLTSPFVGTGESLGHNWWFDKLSMYGLIGTIPWVLVFFQQIKLNLRIINSEQKVYYIIIMVLFLSMGLIKNMGQSRVMVMVFFIIPSIFLLLNKYYNNQKEYLTQNE